MKTANTFSSKHLESIYVVQNFVEYLIMWTIINWEYKQDKLK